MMRGGVWTIAVVGIVLSCSSTDEEPPPPKVYRPKLVDVAISKHYKNDGPFAVAVSDDGRRQYSADFADWSAGGNAFSGPPLRSIVATSDRFLLAGVGYHFELCPNGLSGCIENTPDSTSDGFNSVAICTGWGYYLVGDRGVVRSFQKSGERLSQASGPTGSDTLVGVACDGTRVVVVTKNDVVYTSALGAATLDKVSGTGTACGVAFGNGLFVESRVDGTIETSTDGTTWTVSATAQWSAINACDIAFGGGTFVILTSSGDVFASGDAKTWSKVDYGGRAKLNGVGMNDVGDMLLVGDDAVVIAAKCSAGTCSGPQRHEALVEAIGKPPAGTSSSGGSSGGSCDGCTTDADCTAVAQRYGAAGAACSAGLCYPCRASCSQGNVNCKCLPCGGGCGDAECLGTTSICAYKRDGKKPCD